MENLLRGARSTTLYDYISDPWSPTILVVKCSQEYLQIFPTTCSRPTDDQVLYDNKPGLVSDTERNPLVAQTDPPSMTRTPGKAASNCSRIAFTGSTPTTDRSGTTAGVVGRWGRTGMPSPVWSEKKGRRKGAMKRWKREGGRQEADGETQQAARGASVYKVGKVK